MTSQVHVIFLYHPAADSRTSSLPDAVVKRVETLFPASTCTTHVAHIRYGCLPSTARSAKQREEPDLERFLSSSSSLSLSPFITASRYWELQKASSQYYTSSILLNVVNDVKQPRSDSVRDSLESLMDSETNPSPWLGCLTDGLVAAIELFSRATPATVQPLARYLVHLLPDTPPLDMDDRSFPHSNLDSTHDRWSWIRAAQELGKMAVWPTTHVLSSASGGASSSLTPECEKVHGCILDEMPSTYPTTSDPPSILGGQYKGTSNAQGLLLSGLSDATAAAARASVGASTLLNRKRGRKLSNNNKPQKDKARDGDEKTTPTEGFPSSSIASIGEGVGVARGEIDKVTIHKIVFLQQQQQLMMRNLAVAARQQQGKEPDAESASRQRLLEQFRDQLIAQQAALKSQAAILHSGGPVPNLSSSLTTLISIDKDARDRGLHLGGPSGMQQAMVQRQKQLMHLQQQQQQQQQQPTTTLVASTGPSTSASTTSDAVSTMLSTMSGAVPIGQQPAAAAGNTQPFWNGAILWTVALPNNKRNQAVTFVSAHCAANTTKDSLMLPWQQRLNISEVQSITLSALQSYAAKNNTPCVLFQPLSVPLNGGRAGNNAAGAAPAPQQTNEAMYAMLAKMIDSKKSCAFIPLQGVNCSSDAGMILVPTSAQAGTNNRRLLGLIFKEKIAWNLFAGVASAGQTVQPPVQQQQQQQLAPFNATLSGNVGGVSAPLSTLLASGATPQQGLFQPQPQPQVTPTSTSLVNASAVQQMPVWARPLAATSFSAAQVPQNTIPTSAPVTALSDIVTNSAFDFQGMAGPFNASFNGTQPQPQLQQQVSTAFNTNLFNSNNLWPGQGNGTDQSGMAPSSSAQPPALDMEALQRMLGLNT